MIGGISQRMLTLTLRNLERDGLISRTVTPTVPISTCNQSNSVTGRASLQYHFTDDFMLFGGYARGYKGLAYDLTTTLTDAQRATVEPQRAALRERGHAGSDQRLRVAQRRRLRSPGRVQRGWGGSSTL